ncbi:TRAP transporter substrate-binding protein DctP [Sphingomonas naphthae]|uniref:TRAP transporter substrate-binding protein DctP n=1 Tax=Sphingomonas naphthae TaxID=1813468 RepID=A0ABY7THZ3_9SPHN|nr:TRAP transporter substrate-binding protein DctP [Sphingomonas naphthae]WCT72416.1 TRAP transporter substrate-binding protein DctP [Sphingomonas naphthae]
MSRFRSILALAALAGLAACGKPAPPAGAPITLTYASSYPPGHPFSRADIAWMKAVEAESGGRLRFRPFWGGALLSADQSMTEVRHGVADIGLITPIYAKGGAHMLRAQSGFYGGVRSIGDQVAIYDCLAARFPQFGKELAGLHVLAVQGGNFPGVLTRNRPIRHLADFRGLRLRAQADAIDVLKQLGADPVNMPMGEVYSALAKGVIDGVVAPADTIRSLHFSEVASYFTPIRFSRGAYPARAMSDHAWRRLTPDLQALVMRSRKLWEAELGSELLKAEKAGIDFGKEQGMRFSPFPASEQARFDALYNQDARDQAMRLRGIGLDGLPVLNEAQALIARTGTSGTVRCEADTTTGIK